MISSKDLDCIHGNWVIQSRCAQEAKCARCCYENQQLKGSSPTFFLQSLCGFTCLLFEALPQSSTKSYKMYTVHQCSYLDIENCASSSQPQNIHMDMQDLTQDQLRHSSASPLSVSPQLKSSSWKPVKILCPFMSFWVCVETKVYIITT